MLAADHTDAAARAPELLRSVPTALVGQWRERLARFGVRATLRGFLARRLGAGRTSD